MLSAGKNIRSASDKLERTTSEQLYQQITHPSMQMQVHIRQLRAIKLIDAKHYQESKRVLPYVVAAAFNPEYRRTENFAYADSFFVDIDNLVVHGINPAALKSRLITDERVAMCFLSPGGDGLKLLFNLKQRCYDAAIYKMFYKTFVAQFSEQYGLDEVIDTRTCDVCRACFLSHDGDAYFNPQAIPVDLNAIVDSRDAQAMHDMQLQIEEQQKTEKQQHETASNEEKAVEPASDVMARIRAQLDKKPLKVVEKCCAYVPDILEKALPNIRNTIENLGVILKEERPIQYGKKLVMDADGNEAEINVFYGRRGFSVVETPRRGTSQQLNHLMGQIVKQCLQAG